jgi:hypothetical protein
MGACPGSYPCSAHGNPVFGKRRTRDAAIHPLNGLVICPDCKERMVKGGNSKQKSVVCGTYRKSGRRRCQSNTVNWKKLDRAVDDLLARVSEQLGASVTSNADKLRKQENLIESDLASDLIFFGLACQQNNQHHEASTATERSSWRTSTRS